MRILIIHPENRSIGGAEKMLEYFLAESIESDCQIAVATVEGSRMSKLLPQKAVPIWIQANDSFSLGAVWRQAQVLKQKRTEFHFDVIHGWAARDWELASLVGWWCGCPAFGTLHDHPNAAYISAARRRLMRWCANYGLEKIICVSSAVKDACITAGYSVRKLTAVHNGLPSIETKTMERDAVPFRMGFLGTFSELKGFCDLFQIVDGLPVSSNKAWELHLGGSARDAHGERLLLELRERYEKKPWWSTVRWHGWVQSPREFLQRLDLLIMPSREFDSFPTVLLEAGQVGVPVLAAHVGGVSEIVLDYQTGRLFEPGNISQATAILNELILHPDLAGQMGRGAEKRIKTEFSATKMVAEYRREYFNMVKNV
jgi:glycosyltransferase involved in cell wall biosynthesis